MQFEAKVTSIEKFEADPAQILYQMRRSWANKCVTPGLNTDDPYIANNWWIIETGSLEKLQRITVRQATPEEIETWAAFQHLRKVFSNVSE